MLLCKEVYRWMYFFTGLFWQLSCHFFPAKTMAVFLQCRFNHAWLQMEKYMAWVKTDEDPGRAKCRLCGGKTFNISNMGEAALTINPLYPNRILEHCSILLRKPENSCIFLLFCKQTVNN